MLQREQLRQSRHDRVRKKVTGTSERPRLNVFRSLNNIYAQIINDETGETLVAASTIDKEARADIKVGGNVEAAKEAGKLIAKRALDKGMKRVVFDRGGYQYQGRIRALAEAAREAGLEF